MQVYDYAIHRSSAVPKTHFLLAFCLTFFASKVALSQDDTAEGIAAGLKAEMTTLQDAYDGKREEIKEEIVKLDKAFSVKAKEARDRAIDELRKLQAKAAKDKDYMTVSSIEERIGTMLKSPLPSPAKKRLENNPAGFAKRQRERIETLERELREAYRLEQELIQNPGFEVNTAAGLTPEWTQISGKWNAVKPPHVQEKVASAGKDFFFPGDCKEGVLQQRVDLHASGVLIDEGQVRFIAGCDIMSHKQSRGPIDTCEFKIEFLDGQGKVLRVFTTNQLKSVGKWSPTSLEDYVPKSSRVALVSLVSRRIARRATWNDGYFDNVSLRIKRTR